MQRLVTRLLALLLLGSAAGATPQDLVLVRNIELLVPEGKDLFEAYERVRQDEGLPLDETLVERHVDTLGQLGWVDSVEVDVLGTERDDALDLQYRLVPRDEVREVRIEGNQGLGTVALERVVTSQVGQTFNLRQALDDAHQINIAYQDAGFAFSGVLASEAVSFDEGILTFKVAESRLHEADREHLEAGLRQELEAGALTRRNLSRWMATGDIEGLFKLEELELDLDRSTGELRLGGVEYQRAPRRQAGD